MNKEQIDKLIEDIRFRMAAKRTFLHVDFMKKDAIDELEFLVILLKDINTEESLKTAVYIEKLIEKGKNGTYQIGD